jgi:PhnB protein
VTPFLLCKRAGRVIDFLKGAFDAVELERIAGPRGRILHAVLQLGDSKVMLGEPSRDMPRLVAMPAHHYVFVDDVQASYARAIDSGAKRFSKPVGPRLGAVVDPGGNFWWIATRDLVAPGLIKKRNAEYEAKRAKALADERAAG